MTQSKESPADVRVNIENPENLDVRVLVTVHEKGKAPVTQEYASLLDSKQESRKSLHAGQGAGFHPSQRPGPGSQATVLLLASFKRHIAHLEQTLTPYLNRSNALPLFGLALLVYLLVRWVGITRYPPFFSFDEANMSLIASDFLRDGLRNSNGEFLPVLFSNIDKYSLGTSIYVQTLPLLLFKRSDAITRGFPALISLVAGLAVGLMLREFFKVRFWWAGTLILSLIPAWFLLSRTAYETSLMVSFYAGALYCYLVYRYRNPNYLYPAILFSALAFYSHGAGQLLVSLTAFLLIISDFSYHRENRHTVGLGLLLTFLVALTYLRHYLNHAGDAATYLQNLSTYLFDNVPVSQKMFRFAQEYLSYLNPLYWFKPEYISDTEHDSSVYMMKGYGFIPLYWAPFMAWGFWLTIKNVRLPAYRTILVSLFVAPVSAALVLSPSSITRLLSMVIPAALLITLGLDDLLQRLIRRSKTNNALNWTLPIFIILTALNLYTLGDALLNGPKWFVRNINAFAPTNAHAVFSEINAEIKKNPDQNIIISPIWAMMPDKLTRFYLGDNAPARLTSLYDLAFRKQDLENTLLVVTADELAFAQENSKFTDIQIVKVIPYPDGQPGISFIHLDYSPESDQIFAEEEAQRHELNIAQIQIDGQPAIIAYTQDMGTPVEPIFSPNPNSLYKSNSLNPVIFDITFDQPRNIRSIFIIHGSSPIQLHAQIFPADQQTALNLEADFDGNGDEGNTLYLPQAILTKRVILSIEDPSTDQYGIVHLWKISFD